MKNLFLISLLALSSILSAQSISQEIIDKFFLTYQKNKEKAIRDIYETNTWSVTNTKIIDEYVKIVENLNVQTVGKYYGYELLEKKTISKSIEKHYYVLKYDRQPIRIVFNLYKPNDKWMLASLQIDDNIEDKEIERNSK